MKIALFGGSFDPPHKGHIKIIQTALKQLDIDKIFVCPAFLNPFKKEFHAPPKKRLFWLKKILKKYPSVSICNFEIKREKPTPTIKTVFHLYKYYRAQKVYLIIGADNIESLNKWYRIERLKKLVKIVVVTRGNKKIPKSLQKLEVNVNISSTKLRKKIIKEYIPKEILKDVENFYSKEMNAKS